MTAIFLIGLVSIMDKDEMMFRLAITLAERMLNKGLISVDDFEKMRELLLEKYSPYISELCAK